MAVLGATVFLVWFSLQGIQVEEGQNKWEFILNAWGNAKKEWLALMLLLFMISHILRAERWRMLLQSAGHPSTLYTSFLSVMIGYLVNLAIPRGGEVSRCYNLYKLERMPIEVSFGTVVAERITDLICVAIVVLLAFAIESKKLFGFIESLPMNLDTGMEKIGIILMGIFVLGAFAGVAFWIIKRSTKIKDRLSKLWLGFKSGLGSVNKLHNTGLFILHSVGIWALYFLMSYTVLQAFEETNHLGLNAVLSIFAIGTIAMAAPLPGGAGSYHVLLPAGLVFLYQLPKSNAVAFTFIFHAWQTLILIVAGVFALILTTLLLRKKSVTAKN